MLKLSKIYSNKENIFPRIDFHEGLNIIYANATKKVSDKRSSHSLGKSLLAEIIDYMLIKEVGRRFFLREKDVFKDFVFFLEIKTAKNLYITIERPVVGKASIYSSNAKTNILDSIDYTIIEKNIGIKPAKEKLDKALNLSVVKGALGTYRKGLRYSIRKQEEFLEIFKAKNTNEKDRDWKPYLSGLLGINPDLVAGKYNTKETINRLSSAIKELEQIESTEDSGSALEAEITRLEKTITTMSDELSKFSFQKIDQNITRELVEEIGAKISSTNQNIYTIEQRLHDIDESLKADFDYDIEQVKDLFDSIEINLPNDLVKTFEDLVNLNKKMTHGRKEHLEKAKEKLLSSYKELSDKNLVLNNEQERLSSILIEKESFKKFRVLQVKLSKEESKVAVLQERLKRIDGASELRVRLKTNKREEDELVERLLHNARQNNNNTIKHINYIFGELIKDILGIDAYFYLTINKEGNPHFQQGIADHTSVDRGHSFTKVMAACFDLSLLIHYAENQYYRFSYHDGLLESLDDRVKLRLIDSWRAVSERNNLQLILTVLDTDIPENAQGSKIYFHEGEIIRELHDRGNDGRLFRMEKF